MKAATMTFIMLRTRMLVRAFAPLTSKSSSYRRTPSVMNDNSNHDHNEELRTKLEGLTVRQQTFKADTTARLDELAELAREKGKVLLLEQEKEALKLQLREQAHQRGFEQLCVQLGKDLKEQLEESSKEAWEQWKADMAEREADKAELKSQMEVDRAERKQQMEADKAELKDAFQRSLIFAAIVYSVLQVVLWA
ncbi:hypothetical protein JKP88DRAFT_248187 [Tribonema minus]|uniref:Uncharacterized protein n=1 Tax=Tribonema minus TaxID=303371 RepID=A0A835YN36_9STRA|nr:hypothetical protein JKP88DRAFT_248187 [Tribonema minus]